MKEIRCKKAEFLFSSDGVRMPKLKAPHIVFAGRSNVGKSTLLSSLLGKKNMARTSSTPGKTRLINFFFVDDAFYFVDLPGFGYAKSSKTERDKWKMMIENYLSAYAPLIRFVHLIDARHDLMEQDHLFLEYARDFPVMCVLTKVDKLAPSRREGLIEKKINDIRVSYPYVDFILAFSTKLGYLHGALMEALNDWLQKSTS
ncbi:MAG: ribosome biogenesis GTP-binding protein YsxC [Chlamydiae bacterium RIFCSPHIGHO2_12_FULL_49_11]|nr:MAG: ribosome biogenesis GTP-binding protein YsxC [Chlamydiae bacterium RIFCSPHIGHO2_12_FULL_49_11]